MRLCITFAIQMQSVAVGWQVYELTHKNTLALGFIGLAEAIPAMGIALYAGHLVDSMNRRNIILYATLILLFSSSLLWFFTLDISRLIIPNPVVSIFFVIFLTGLARGFLSPANFAFMSQLVNKEQLGSAIAWNSTNWQIAAVCGPAAGGLLYGFVGISITYFVQILLIALALVFCLLIQSKPAPVSSQHNDIWERLSAGIKFVFQHQIILAAITLDLFAVLFGGAVALLPAFASDILKVGTEGLGFLRAAPAMGAVLTAVLLAYRPISRNAGNILLWSVAGFGLSMLFFALSVFFWLSLFLLFLSGVFDSISVIIRSTVLQKFTPENMKGRVLAVNSIFISSSNEIGAFESGLAARVMGLVASVVFGGCMTLLVVGITALKAKDLRKLSL